MSSSSTLWAGCQGVAGANAVVRVRQHHVESDVALVVDVLPQREGEVHLTEADLRAPVAAGDVRTGLPAPQRQELRAECAAYEQQATQSVAAVRAQAGVPRLGQAFQERQQPVEALGVDGLGKSLPNPGRFT
ncbi:hypothetical protein [Streptomyces sp. NPDC048392]|uniref:hypothetical protein n=1 Tax=Streptomyces sp. NPDC048392 TaxID=3365543 RepID=UPI003716B882